MGQEDYLDQLLNSLNNDDEQSNKESDIVDSLVEEPEVASDEFLNSDELETTFSEEDLINEFLTNEDADSYLLKNDVLNDNRADVDEIDNSNEEMLEDNSEDISDIMFENDNSEDISDIMFENENLDEESVNESDVDFQEVIPEISDETNADEDSENDSGIEDIMSQLLEDELDKGNEIIEQLDNLDNEDLNNSENAELFDLEDLLSDEEIKEEIDENIFSEAEADAMFAEGEDSNEESINVDDLLSGFDFSDDAEEVSMEDLENMDNLSDEQNAILSDLDSILEEANRVEADNLANGNLLDDTLEEDVLGNLNLEDENGVSDSVDDILGGLDLGFDANEMDLFADDDLENLLGEDVKNLNGNEPIEMTEEEASKALDDITNMTSDESKDEAKKKKGLFSKLFSKKDKDSSESEASETAEPVVSEAKPKKEKKKKEKKKKEKTKSKKPKREKKPKKEKVVLPPEPWVGVSKGKVISIILLMGSMIAFVLICVKFIPYNLSMSNAHDYYEHQEYSEAYEAMIGLEINESDLDFFYKVQNIMFLQSKYDEYQTYTGLGKKYEALSALIRAVEKYDIHIEEANIYGAAPAYAEMYEKVEKALQDDFGVAVDEARNIYILETSSDYSRAIYDILGYEEVVEE